MDGHRMDGSIGAFEAKTHLSALLERVERGESFTITRHGRPVARLVPVQARDPERIREAIAAFKELRKGITLGGIPLKELLDEGKKGL
jgi:prevent-host-death family protein